jgi:hypothetical protein
VSYPFTQIVPYYDNAEMFREQQRVWRGLHPKQRASLHVIVVDDGSPKEPAIDHLEPETPKAMASFRLFRTDVDVRWNWIFCRNLGAEQTTTEWMLMTDMDHVIPGETWHALFRKKLDRLYAYRLSRVDAPDMEPCPPHPNTWIMTRHMFRERVGGYDERFSGIYGSDGEFHRRVDLWARHVELLDAVAIRYSEAVIPDACTTTYTRKEAFDREQKTLIRDEIKALGTAAKPKRLTFPWSRVYP